MGRASIRQVAEAAGVSMSTVSNVLNNPHRVALPTLERVEAAMRRTGYVRNGAARQLRGAPSSLVGCVLLDTADAYFATVARGVEDRLAEAGCVLVQCSTDMRVDREDRCLRMLAEQGVRGVLLTPTATGTEALTRLVEQGMPVVLLDHPADGSGLAAVGADHAGGGALAARHLLGLGHRRLAFVRAGAVVRRPVRDRLGGIVRAVREAGLHPAAALSEWRAPHPAAAEETAAALAALPPAARPTAVICGNDAVALAVCRGLRGRGTAVPGEMSVVGYGDADFAAGLSPALTTVRQPSHDIGFAAAGLLLQGWEPGGGVRRREITFAPELVVRASTAPPP